MSYLFGGNQFSGYGPDGRRSLNMGGGGGGGPSNTTTQTSNIPDWLRPQVEAGIGAATQQLFNVTPEGQITGLRSYVPYSTNPADYVAQFSPMQKQSFQSAANLQTPGQFGTASTLANQAGQGALGTVGQATGYGSMGSQFGSQGAQIGQGALGYGAMGAGIGTEATQAGSNYQAMATDPGSVQAYMNPYIQASLAPQLEMMNQQQAKQNQTQAAQATAAGAYGGTRGAVERGQIQQANQLARQQMIGNAYNQAFQQAQQSQQFGANLGLQGLQTGIQGAGVGLQGIQGALAGTAQGMQGAQIGLQGVQGAQAGYGLANQAAQNLGQLGTSQLAAQQSIINQQNQLGAQQQARQQAITNQAIQDFANAQVYPQQQLGFYNAMVRGYATPTVTTSQYSAAPNAMSQLAGAGLTAAAGYGLMKKKGGVIKESDGLEELGMYRAMKGE